jgi:YD repeat-containing protein
VLVWLLSVLFFVLSKVICPGEFPCVIFQQRQVCMDLVTVNSPGKLLLVSSNLSSRIRDAQPTPGAQREGRTIETLLPSLVANTASTDKIVTTYTAGDQVATQTDASGIKLTFTYDARNRQLTQKDALNQTTTTVYNADNQVTQITQPKGTIYKRSYDAMLRISTVTDPLNNAITYGGIDKLASGLSHGFKLEASKCCWVSDESDLRLRFV